MFSKRYFVRKYSVEDGSMVWETRLPGIFSTSRGWCVKFIVANKRVYLVSNRGGAAVLMEDTGNYVCCKYLTCMGSYISDRHELKPIECGFTVITEQCSLDVHKFNSDIELVSSYSSEYEDSDRREEFYHFQRGELTYFFSTTRTIVFSFNSSGLEPLFEVKHLSLSCSYLEDRWFINYNDVQICSSDGYIALMDDDKVKCTVYRIDFE